jgi:hypothetical protein
MKAVESSENSGNSLLEEDIPILMPVQSYQKTYGIFSYDVRSLLSKRSSSYVHRKISKEIAEILGDSI